MKPSDEFTAAFRVIFLELMKNGNNYMEAGLFADGHLFKVKISIEEVIE